MAESYVAYLDMLRDAPSKKVKGVPILVVGADSDAVFSPTVVWQTAAAYGVEAEIFTGMGHDMMPDTGWESVADRIMEWTTSLS